MSRSAMGIGITDVDTAAKMPLGYIHIEPAQSVGTDANQGERVWIYVKANVALAAGEIAIRDPSAITLDWFEVEKADASAPTSKVMCVGVAQHAIAAGSFGFIQCKGVGTVLPGSAGVAADSPFMSGGSAAGTALVWSDGTANESGSIIGHTGTALAASTAGAAWIDCL
jgi:hypothetical protein